MKTAFRIDIRVYMDDTDANGMVYHASYLRYMERARTEYIRSLGLDREALSSSGRLLVVHTLKLRYRAPARLDDLLQVSAGVARCGRASLILEQRVEHQGRLLVGGQVGLACVSHPGLRPCALPEALMLHQRPAGCQTDGKEPG